MTHDDRDGRQPQSDTSNAPRMQWLLWPLAGSALLITLQAWSAASGPQTTVAAPQQDPVSPPVLADTVAARLSPTAHPAVPATLETMWYVRDASAQPEPGALANLARGVRLLDDSGDAAEALPLVSASALARTEVSDYARYYTGIALQRLNRLDEADAAFAEVAARKVQGQLPEAAAYRQAEIREARDDFAGAAAIYEQLLEGKVASPPIALVKLGAAASAAGNRERAIYAHRRVLREFPLAAEAAEAEELLDRLGGFALDTPGAVREELGRAEALFKAKRWAQAQSAYERVRDLVEGEDRDRVTVRLAQIQAANGQHRAARDVLRRFVAHETLAPEAQFGVVSATRNLREGEEFLQLTSDFVARNPTHPLAEEALNELARYYILDDEDAEAAEVYSRMVERFPSGAFAERAVWKAGWWAYREKNFRETIRLFEHGATTFPRSDYRPSWLYWSARAYDQVGDLSSANQRYRVTVIDYLNTYYGRLAWRQLEQRDEAAIEPSTRAVVTAPAPPPTADRIARLIDVGLYRPALNEVQYAQKMWGDSPQLQATLAFVHNKLGNLRLGINAMKRAYPQYMTAGGEALPTAILHVLFPVDYWPLLKGHAQARGLDPYVVAALVAQESTFDAVIRSPANAIGLMQVIPSTGRRYAKKIGIRQFSERTLTNPELNVSIGMQYFADLVNRFGAHHFALASYNAGEHRVQRWLEETPNLPQDEFIDNIPFPETQNYVKRILGTADDYRRLYGDGQVPTVVTRKAPAKAPAKKSVTTKKTPTKKAPAKKAPAKKKGATSARP
jgi:soluble lytic murein transglycosylase